MKNDNDNRKRLRKSRTTRTSTPRHVHFRRNEIQGVHNIPHVNSFTDKQKVLLWYQDSDYDAMDDEIDSILETMLDNDKSETSSRCSTNECTRGLEASLPEPKEFREKRRKAAWNAVIDEQFKQWKIGHNDPELIAKVYRESSICHAQGFAYLSALGDEQDAFKIYRESKIKNLTADSLSHKKNIRHDDNNNNNKPKSKLRRLKAKITPHIKKLPQKQKEEETNHSKLDKIREKNLAIVKAIRATRGRERTIQKKPKKRNSENSTKSRGKAINSRPRRASDSPTLSKGQRGRGRKRTKRREHRKREFSPTPTMKSARKVKYASWSGAKGNNKRIRTTTVTVTRTTTVRRPH